MEQANDIFENLNLESKMVKSGRNVCVSGRRVYPNIAIHFLWFKFHSNNKNKITIIVSRAE